MEVELENAQQESENGERLQLTNEVIPLAARSTSYSFPDLYSAALSTLKHTKMIENLKIS